MTRPAVFTIPPHRAFADALAAGLIARFGSDPTALARGLILIPNNRAGRAITDAFVRRSEGGLLLPRLAAVSDPELDESIGGALELIDGEPIPPAIEPMRRLMILAGLIAEDLPDMGAAEALRLAGDLARTLDQLLVEEIELSRLARLADLIPDLSEHWQASLGRLDVILRRWPEKLRQLERVDLSDRRNRLLAAVEKRWRNEPPPGFVVAAGVTTTAPAIARLLGRVARMPEGMVVLPALDLHMPEDEWDALGPHEPDPQTGLRHRPIETHPQFHLKLLLDRMSVGRSEVERWRWGGGRDAPAARSRSIGNAMAPARFTGKWRTLKPEDRRLTGVRALELADPAEEAQAIAIALREALETPGRTAALVTPDRTLARRVSAHLRRWGIEADDSAGRPLSETPPGTLLLALAAAAADRFAPVPLLALLKHPLVRQGAARAQWLEGARSLDLALRGPRPPAGLAGIASHLADGNARESKARRPAVAWWEEAAALLSPLEAAFEAAGEPPALLAALRDIASNLSGNAIWAGQAGRDLADLLVEAESALSDGPDRIVPGELPSFLEQLMEGVAVRPPFGQHPRIFIWGLIEGRLQHADLVILGGLNEGVWPAFPAPDPWLAPRIRSELGLPDLERRIGLAAHDFAIGLGARQVLVTRARRDARAPAIASRFWLRLEAMTGGIVRAPIRKETSPGSYRAWATALDRPGEHLPASRPEPSPPVEVRPRKIAVTELDRLKADPFAFYARKMLGLAVLDTIDAEPSAAWRGTAVHDVLEKWMLEDDCDPTRLRARAEEFLAAADAHPLMRALWQPRLMEAIDWIAERIAGDRQAGRNPLRAEAWGEAEVAGIALHGKADRIDRMPDGMIAIVDYKTGKAPSAKAVREGYAMQLGLLGLIAEHRGFDGVDGVPIAFEYWSLAKHQGSFGHISSPVGGKAGIDPSDFTAEAARNLVHAVETWLLGDTPFTAKLHPEHAPYSEYDQLMRLQEWYGREKVNPRR